MFLGVVVALLTACGRLGFDPVAGQGAGMGDGSVPGDGVGDGAVANGDGMGSDAAMMPMIACADMNLGSALGPNVASGSVNNAGNQYQGCSGDGNDVTFGWFAPAAGNYRIDLCGSQQSWDSVLSVRDGSCTGSSLACDDDSCGGAAGLQGRVTVTLTAGQGIVIIVDSLAPQNGNYQLAITQL
jgi:hypothetical protein